MIEKLSCCSHIKGILHPTNENVLIFYSCAPFVALNDNVSVTLSKGAIYVLRARRGYDFQWAMTQMSFKASHKAIKTLQKT